MKFLSFTSAKCYKELFKTLTCFPWKSLLYQLKCWQIEDGIEMVKMINEDGKCSKKQRW